MKEINYNQRKAIHLQKEENEQLKNRKILPLTNKNDKTKELRKWIGQSILCRPQRNVAEQKYCLLHLKNLTLKVAKQRLKNH